MDDSTKDKDERMEEILRLRGRLAALGDPEGGRGPDDGVSHAMRSAFEEGEERYRALFERSLFYIFVYDLEGRFLDANEAVLRRLGYTREELLASTVLSIVGEVQAPKARRTIEEIKRTGSMKEPNEYRLTTRTGEVVWVETESSLLYRRGKPYAILGIARDMTERLRVEEALTRSEERYRTLFEESQDVLFITTPEGNLVDINPAGIELFGFPSKAEILKVDIAKDLYFDPRDREQYQLAMDRLGRVTEYEVDL